jgi:energy-coupling factor transporter ATP-binding protein EcfA2
VRLGCEDLVVRYPMAVDDALGPLDFEFGSGELVAVLGASGSGKSTLLLAISALMEASGGRVLADGEELEGRRLGEVRRRLGVVFQFPETQLFGATVFEEVAFGPALQGLTGEAVGERVERALAQAGLDGALSRRSPFTISGGEQRRVALAAALATDPDLLLFDEPTSGLDAKGREDMIALVRSLVDSGRGALVVSHDPAILLPAADRALVLEAGRAVWEGPAQTLRSDADLARSLGVGLGVEDEVAFALRSRGWDLSPRESWTPDSLARAIAGSRA